MHAYYYCIYYQEEDQQKNVVFTVQYNRITYLKMWDLGRLLPVLSYLLPFSRSVGGGEKVA